MRFFIYFDKITSMLLFIFNFLSRVQFFFRVGVKKNVKKNRELKKKHERCFVICNGPSLSETNIEKIRNADTITVNFFYNNDLYPDFESNYHVAIDGAMYEGVNINYLRNILKRNVDTKIIVKQNAISLFETEKQRVYGVYAKQVQIGDKVCVDFEKNVTTAINVSIMATQLALYLGYKEIYLLGVDFSEFVYKNGGVKHFYKDDKSNNAKGLSKGNQLRWFSLAYQHHYALQKYAKKRNINIYNCTPDSYLDAYPYVEFSKIIESQEEI